MSAHMRKHHTKDDYSSSDKQEKRVSWTEMFREGIEKFSEVGLVLRGARYKAELTQKELAEAIEVQTHHISEMEHGKRPIGKKMAHRLAKVLGVDYRILL